MSMTTIAVESARPGVAARVRDYIELAKPKISVLVLVTVAVAYSVALWGRPVPLTLCHALVSTLLVAASASALNQWLERRRDHLMSRTADRPLPAGRLGEFEVLLFAALTIAAGLAYALVLLNWQAALYGGLTWLTYVWLYTPLKVRTPLNTVVGAVAGALPVLIGWSAAGAPLNLRAAALFCIVFLWQFPHFMAIAWLYRLEYGRAGMKMLTVVDASGRLAGAQAVLAALVLIPVSVVPVLHLPGRGGLYYAGMAVLLGLWQCAGAAAFCRRRDEASARRLLRMSLVYLPLLLVCLMLVPWL